MSFHAHLCFPSPLQTKGHPEDKALEQVLPEVRADGSKHISVTREGPAMVHLHNDVCQLRFIIQGFKLLEDGAGVQGVYTVVACACRSPVLYL